MAHESVRLTETVKKGGCAAKLPAGELRKVLEGLALPKPSELAVGTETLDDACLWDLGNGQYMVQTLDFFTPIVDDPRAFGAIAAANALSDVFAMGGRPRVALTILAFPSAALPMTVLGELMAGAVDTITRSGACLAGGHTIDDDTLKLGFSVTGFVDKQRAWRNAGARSGDVLILTKGLGTGTIASAIKKRTAEPAWIDAAVASMTALNDTTGLLDGITVHAATDVTGFGLAGHALQMAQASGVAFEIATGDLPVLAGASTALERGTLNRAHHSNAAYVEAHAVYEDVADAQRWLTVDPQTSGGLLLSIPEADAARALESLRQRFPLAARCGRVVDSEAAGARLKFRR
jgi:selenide,water dikinase